MFTARHWAMLDRLASNLAGYAFALCHDRDRAADLVQDAILRAMNALKVPEDEVAFRVWLIRILRNLWIDDVRAARRREERLRHAADDARATTPLPGSDELVVNRIVIRQAFFALSANHRDVLALVDIAGFSYDEAAQMLDVNRGTIMSRVSRARQELMRRLADERGAPLRVIRGGRRHD